MLLTGWYRRRHPKEPSPIPSLAEAVEKQARDISKQALEIRLSQQAREKKA